MSYLDSLLASEETLQLVTRRHWVTILKALVLNGVAIAVVTLLAGIATQWLRMTGDVVWTILTLALVALWLWFLARIVVEIVRWTATQYAITTRRVLEVTGVFNRVVRDSNLDKINDLVLTQSFMGRALGYGDIEIITGSDVGVNKLEKIRDPIGFKKVMLDNKEDFDTLSRRSDDSG